ncbi:MAG: acetylxylan esterase [Pirellulaceae bacterium]|nr:acetylxylan esterase [Pirellulaceae bacterium]
MSRQFPACQFPGRPFLPRALFTRRCLACPSFTVAWLMMLTVACPGLWAAAPGTIETVAGTGRPENNGGAGPALEVNVGDPFGVEVGPDGALYITEVRNHRVLRLDRETGRLTTVAGTGQKGYAGDGGPATKALLNEPYEVRFDKQGNLYFVEMQNHVVRKVAAGDGTISTVAGTGQAGYGGDGGPAVKAQMRQPHSIALDHRGGLYVADIGNHRIRRIDLATGQIESIAGDGQRQLPREGQLARGQPVLGPRALFIDGQTLWVALREGHSVCRLPLDTGRWHHVAGTGQRGFSGDGGPAAEATFDGPKGIALGPDGHIYVADTENQAIRRIELPGGRISTVAGGGPKERGGGGDGGLATSAQLDRPHGICLGPDGSLYIGDTLNHRVRRVQSRLSLRESSGPLRDALRQLNTDPTAEPNQSAAPGAQMLREQLRDALRAANRQSTEEWRRIESREDWERFRDEKLNRLRESLGHQSDEPPALSVRVTGSHDGPGYRVENLVFASRPGLWITANRYRPEPARQDMPGILICHSHHTPKEHPELQHMGMTWARRGAVVMVMDQIGHGERRQHPFRSAADYPQEFRASRQDYYFRYDNGIQLHLAGESLMGQMVRDLRRGVDLLLEEPGVDPRRIVLLGAVAGGGDPAAVTAALDTRIAVAVPFNFGGPQPETRFPLPEDADELFNYAGSGSWESTRNLRRSAAEGFLPWAIVGGIAPRKLIYAHEFAWDRHRDPVWRRLERIQTWYESDDGLDWVHGFGAVTLRPPDASHCTHIGPVHRERIHAALERWFGLPAGEPPEWRQERPADELRCLTDAARDELQPARLHEVLAGDVDRRLTELRAELEDRPADARRMLLAERWQRALGPVGPVEEPRAGDPVPLAELPDGCTAQRLVLEVEPGISVPLVLLLPRRENSQRVPVVVLVAQEGKRRLLAERAGQVAELLAGQVAVCLPDLRGTGQTQPDAGRSRQSSATSLSSTALMLDGTLVGARLRDLRSVLAYLRGRDELDAGRLAVWGDSLAEPNPRQTQFEVPWDIDRRPRQSEPLGGILALLAALYEPQLRAVVAHGGLAGYREVLESPFVYIPHDVVVPGALDAGDLCDLAAAIAPTPLLASGLVDGWNRLLDEAALRRIYSPALASYKQQQAERKIRLTAERSTQDTAGWLLEQLE